jgi:hypothetical protein
VTRCRGAQDPGELESIDIDPCEPGWLLDWVQASSAAAPALQP